MRTPDEYREFAAECYSLAAEAETEMYQKMMEEMARAWSEVAEEVETKITQQRRGAADRGQRGEAAAFAPALTPH